MPTWMNSIGSAAIGAAALEMVRRLSPVLLEIVRRTVPHRESAADRDSRETIRVREMTDLERQLRAELHGEIERLLARVRELETDVEHYRDEKHALNNKLNAVSLRVQFTENQRDEALAHLREATEERDHWRSVAEDTEPPAAPR